MKAITATLSNALPRLCLLYTSQVLRQLIGLGFQRGEAVGHAVVHQCHGLAVHLRLPQIEHRRSGELALDARDLRRLRRELQAGQRRLWLRQQLRQQMFEIGGETSDARRFEQILRIGEGGLDTCLLYTSARRSRCPCPAPDAALP